MAEWSIGWQGNNLLRPLVIALIFLFGASACLPLSPAPPLPSSTALPPLVRFAVIGDYGSGDQNAADVAALVKSWKPDFILTVGDNNYPYGSAKTIDANIGQFYHEFIHPYRGAYGQGADINRFFPTLGNHDWLADGAYPYLDYFTLPGNERYYDFVWGPLHLFAVDSDSHEPDGVDKNSTQAVWLQKELAESPARWKIIYLHHPPYVSGANGGVDWMAWPFEEWGADLVLAGHDHIYERVEVDGFPYLINGLGGGAIYALSTPVPGSLARYNQDYGALLVEASETGLMIQFITRNDQVVDTFQLIR